MKKILFIILILSSSLSLFAQYDGYIGQPVCWDSAGVLKIQLFTINYHTLNRTDGVWRGYVDRQGNVVAATENEITVGWCNLIDITTNTTPVLDTMVNITCMRLTRTTTNTVNATSYYPQHVLEKHTITVGSAVIETKYYEPHTMQLFESPLLSISVIECNDFNVNEINSMISSGDTISVTAGDTVTVSLVGASVFDIVCNSTSMNTVKLDITYENVPIEGFNYTVGGTKTAILRPYANSFSQSWEIQRFLEVDVIAIGSNCECSYIFSGEIARY